MKIDTNINLSRSEAMRRHILGIGLISAVLLSPAIPSWIALLACYPLFTAIMQWDPIDALLKNVVASMGSTTQNALFVKSVKM
jgi:hypothetical protein